jgi:hypothetical protein
MLTLNILGVPKRREALCPTCVYVVMQKGLRGEELTSCCLGGGVRELKFEVVECSAYTDRRIVRPKRVVGFASSTQPEKGNITVIKIA